MVLQVASPFWTAQETAAGLEELEVRLLLEGVYQHYGYDFRGFAHSATERLVRQAVRREHVHSVSALQDRVLHDRPSLLRLAADFAVNVTGLFREPRLFRALRDEAMPILATFPSLRAWVAGCATGEEAYSLAIVLRESLPRGSWEIYATDINRASLEIARRGIYPQAEIKSSQRRFVDGGGTGDLASHFCEQDSQMVLVEPALRRRITWAEHNLAHDASFNEFHLILCANVLIYFDSSLKQRAHLLMHDSLVRGGYLGLGGRESLAASPRRGLYKQVVTGVPLYRRMR
jgi:chemotaxis protein methyltransferase CheR